MPTFGQKADIFIFDYFYCFFDVHSDLALSLGMVCGQGQPSGHTGPGGEGQATLAEALEVRAYISFSLTNDT